MAPIAGKVRKIRPEFAVKSEKGLTVGVPAEKRVSMKVPCPRDTKTPSISPPCPLPLFGHGA
jgi:hypothetical protein